MVGTEWIEHSTPTVSMWCSPTELRARTIWWDFPTDDYSNTPRWALYLGYKPI
jgi:hypothetical protein